MVRFRPSYLAVFFSLFVFFGVVLSPPVLAAEQSAAAQAVVQPSQVNINTASAEDISTVLKGVGPSKASAIVEYRRANGSFTDVEQLLDVKGIGERTLEINQDKILVN